MTSTSESGGRVYNAWTSFRAMSGAKNFISLPLIHLSQALPGAAGFHLRKGRGVEESWEAVRVGFKPVLT